MQFEWLLHESFGFHFVESGEVVCVFNFPAPVANEDDVVHALDKRAIFYFRISHALIKSKCHQCIRDLWNNKHHRTFSFFAEAFWLIVGQTEDASKVSAFDQRHKEPCEQAGRERPIGIDRRS